MQLHCQLTCQMMHPSLNLGCIVEGSPPAPPPTPPPNPPPNPPSSPPTVVGVACPAACLGDIDQDGAVATSDMLVMLTQFGQHAVNYQQGTSLPGDINCDGNVNSIDLLDFLIYYGVDCDNAEE